MTADYERSPSYKSPVLRRMRSPTKAEAEARGASVPVKVPWRNSQAV
jgi:hypothetical protein